ncbi:MAG: hypothetical protein ACR2PT_18835 [Endozoicomonas sp.]
MYLVRKKFMYWQVPATTKIHFNSERQGNYCFVPARLVSKLEKALKRIGSMFSQPVAKTLRDRRIRCA